MAIAYSKGSYNYVAGGNNLILDFTSAPAQGEVLIASFASASTAATVTPPTGWHEYQVYNNNGLITIYFYKVAGSSESKSYTFGTGGTTANIIGQIVTFTGVDNNSPFIDKHHHDYYNSTTAESAFALENTHHVIDTVLVGMYACDASSTSMFNPPTGYTASIDHDDGGTVSIGSSYSGSMTSEAETADLSMSTNVSVTAFLSHHIALRPSGHFKNNLIKSGIPRTITPTDSTTVTENRTSIAFNKNAIYILTTQSGTSNALYVYDHNWTQLQTITGNDLYLNFEFNTSGYDMTMDANNSYIYFTDRSGTTTDNLANIMRQSLNADGTLASLSPTLWKDVDALAGDKDTFIGVNAGSTDIHLLKGDQFYQFNQSDGVQTANLTMASMINLFDADKNGSHFHTLAVTGDYIIATAREYGSAVWDKNGNVVFGETATAGGTRTDIHRVYYDFMGMDATDVGGHNHNSGNYKHIAVSEDYPDIILAQTYFSANDPYRSYFISYDANSLWNAAPNAPIIDSPTGTSTSPAIVTTKTPTLDWTFSDSDTGDSQSAYEVNVYKGTTLIHATGKVASTNTYFTPPTTTSSGTAWAWDTTYNFEVRTWDQDGAVGPYSALEYYHTNQAPSATNLDPGSTDSTAPEGTKHNAKLTWSYSDPDAGAQSAYQVKVYDMATTPVLVHDSTKVASADAFYQLPDTALSSTSGTKYQWEVTVWDEHGTSATSVREYIVINNVPASPTLASPVDTYRTTTLPVYQATIGDDVENNNQHFVIQIAEDSAFSVGLQELDSSASQTGWEAKTSTGSFVAMPTGGVDYTYEGGTVQFTTQIALVEGKTYYWRMRAKDVSTGDYGSWSATRSIRCGNQLQFGIKDPIVTSANADRIVFSATKTIATDGTNPASIKVEVCNNGLDITPTWEDATSAFLNKEYYQFTNTSKTANDWAVDVRVTVNANDSLNAIEFDGIGFSFD